MRKYGYLVVEGQHDVEFVCRLLKFLGFKRITLEKEVDSFFSPLIPHEFPYQGDLHKRMPTPTFLKNDTLTIAVHSANGDDNIANLMEEDSFEIKLSEMRGIGVLLDSDDKTPQMRYESLKKNISKKTNLQQFKFSDELGVITQGTPRLGAFVLPDNQNKGTLEDLLLESAALVYPKLYECAKAYINCAKTNANSTTSSSKNFNKPTGEKKAIVGAMATILKPGKAVQMSIQDNDWIGETSLSSIPRIQAVQTFLKTLFEL